MEITKALVNHGAKVNALTAVGKPAIHFALLHNHMAVAKYLRENGWSPGETAPITGLLASADLKRGKSIATKYCQETCHSLDEGKTGAFGPSLWDLIGNPMASFADFSYSPAFARLDGTWTFEALNRFLARPFEVMPGTKMNYPRMSDAQERADLVAYLRTLSDNPVPLP